MICETSVSFHQTSRRYNLRQPSSCLQSWKPEFSRWNHGSDLHSQVSDPSVYFKVCQLPKMRLVLQFTLWDAYIFLFCSHFSSVPCTLNLIDTLRFSFLCCIILFQDAGLVWSLQTLVGSYRCLPAPNLKTFPTLYTHILSLVQRVLPKQASAGAHVPFPWRLSMDH